MATGKVLYKVSPVAEFEKLEDFVAYVNGELEAIEQSMLLVLPNQMEALHVAPVRPREGLIAFADGTDWDPGTGKGIYAYYSSAWHKLG